MKCSSPTSSTTCTSSTCHSAAGSLSHCVPPRVARLPVRVRPRRHCLPASMAFCRSTVSRTTLHTCALGMAVHFNTGSRNGKGAAQG